MDTGRLQDELANLQPRTFVLRDSGPARLIRSPHTLSYLRGPLTRAEVARLTHAPREERAPGDGLFAAPPVPPEGLPVRWLELPGLAPLLDGGVMPTVVTRWRPAIVARWAVRLDDGDWYEDQVIHQVALPLVPDSVPRGIALDDGWILRRAPNLEARYEGVPAWLFTRGAVSLLKERWRDLVARETVGEGPTGTVTAERGDVQELAFALVWVPG